MQITSQHRVRIRKGLQLFSLLLFPITLNWFSPYLIVDGAAHGFLAGSALTFAVLALSAIVLGRAWCGWLCPAGSLMDACSAAQPKGFAGRRFGKWAVWTPWMLAIALLLVRAGRFPVLRPFYHLENGISVRAPHHFVTYYAVLALFAVPALIWGRRAACHQLCWIAPFVIIGDYVGRKLGVARLRLSAKPDLCRDCRSCDRQCPMGLGVSAMVKHGNMEHTDCILCAGCADGCPQEAIQLGFQRKP